VAKSRLWWALEMRIVLRPNRNAVSVHTRNTASTLLPSFIYWPREWAKSAWDYIDENFISFGLHDQPLWLRAIMVAVSISVAVYYFGFLHERGETGHADFNHRISELYHAMERVAVVAGILGYFFRTGLSRRKRVGEEEE